MCLGIVGVNMQNNRLCTKSYYNLFLRIHWRKRKLFSLCVQGHVHSADVPGNVSLVHSFFFTHEAEQLLPLLYHRDTSAGVSVSQVTPWRANRGWGHSKPRVHNVQGLQCSCISFATTMPGVRLCPLAPAGWSRALWALSLIHI